MAPLNIKHLETLLRIPRPCGTLIDINLLREGVQPCQTHVDEGFLYTRDIQRIYTRDHSCLDFLDSLSFSLESVSP
ncbi:hypothetical protein J6590_095223 [Homalodisca vitripennis]|nr:hypothetical protein J6590_095223 [Homalodisca vitripennis]